MNLTAAFDDRMAEISERIRNSRMSVHSVLLAQHGQLLGQWHRSPYDANNPHRMYSVSKSITAIGIGLLAQDGEFSLDDPLHRVFPQFHTASQPLHPWIAQATLRDLLQMRSPHFQTTYKRYDGPWLESFFRVEPTHHSGTVFRYDTSASYAMAALVEQRTGKTLTEFLQQRAFKALGVSAGMHYLTSPEGHSSGGSGLICDPLDMVKVATWLSEGGVINGRQVLDPDFIAAATTRQVPTAMQTWGTRFEYGYGYQIWVPCPGAFLFFGMGGQLVLAIPEQGIVLVVTADTQRIGNGEQLLIDLMWQELLEPLFPGALQATPFVAGGNHLLDPVAAWEGTYTSVTNPAAFVAPGAQALAGEQLGVTMGLTGGELRMPARNWQIPFAYGQVVEIADFAGFGYATVTGGWLDEHFLKLVVEIQSDEVSSVEVELFAERNAPTPDALTLNVQGYGEQIPAAWSGVQTLQLG